MVDEDMMKQVDIVIDGDMVAGVSACCGCKEDFRPKCFWIRAETVEILRNKKENEPQKDCCSLKTGQIDIKLSDFLVPSHANMFKVWKIYVLNAKALVSIIIAV